jgi:hypothetical protein
MQYTFGKKQFTWGTHTAGDVRNLYLKAIQQAAVGNLVHLLNFAQH